MTIAEYARFIMIRFIIPQFTYETDSSLWLHVRLTCRRLYTELFMLSSLPCLFLTFAVLSHLMLGSDALVNKAIQKLWLAGYFTAIYSHKIWLCIDPSRAL